VRQGFAETRVPEEVGVDERYETLLRRLAVLDAHAIEAALALDACDDPGITCDPRITALVRLAGLVALQSSPQAYEWCVAAALTAGSSEEEIVAVLAALAPVVGVTRVSTAADNVAAALGYQVNVPGQQ
jgi:alkylhydroperoxidase/carboxymuconolactone decarboxylase family protein YurZ